MRKEYCIIKEAVKHGMEAVKHRFAARCTGSRVICIRRQGIAGLYWRWKMDMIEMKEFVLEFLEKDDSNRIPAGIAKKPEYAGRKIYDGVAMGVAAADDDIIVSLKANKEANLDLMQPEEWLPGAKSVVSFFMAYSRWITEENTGGEWPSDGWLHGRIEGHTASNNAIVALVERIGEKGFEAVIPTLDPRIKVFMKFAGCPESLYTTNWAERHIAFAAGLGSFGLSRGIITELGMAGRFVSLVTTAPLAPTPRKYTDLYEYCTKCGDCVRACPPKAISLEHLKDHPPCDIFLETVKAKEGPYYGCGKCQSGTPCSHGIPAAL